MSISAQLPSTPAPNGTRALWITAIAVVVADQITKWLVMTTMDLYQSVPIIGDALRLTYIRNSGGAFGLRWGHSAVYYVSAALIIGWIIHHVWRHGVSRRLSAWALSLILGGAIGNLIDRVMRGEVIDFLDAEFFDLRIPSFNLGILHHPGYNLDRWPTFNVADSAVTIGVLALMFSLWRDPVLYGKAPIPSATESPAQGELSSPATTHGPGST
ncbi:MAG: signal peptidase II [Candidatus Zixiibacteriota bacterium]